MNKVISWMITFAIMFVMLLAIFPLMIEYEDYWDALNTSLEDCVHYNDLRIVKQDVATEGYKFTVISETNKTCEQPVLMTWRDSAVFYDEKDNLIPRTIPCQPEYGIKLSSKVCQPDGWYQYQWWRDVNLNKGKTTEPWFLYQKKIPPDAVSMGITSFQTGILYDGMFGEIESSQIVKTTNLWRLDK